MKCNSKSLYIAIHPVVSARGTLCVTARENIQWKHDSWCVENRDMDKIHIATIKICISQMAYILYYQYFALELSPDVSLSLGMA